VTNVPSAPDTVCIGESMVILLPEQPGPLEDADRFRRSVGGAESNVACGLAALGTSASWISRVGDDGFGRLIRAELAGHGVNTSGVIVDPHRPTGLYVKEIGGRTDSPHDLGPGRSSLHYYRTGSAASALSPATLDAPAAAALLAAARLIHLSGITAALGQMSGEDGGRRLVETVFDRRRAGQLVSFDLNWRPGLWRRPSFERRGPETLAALADRADIVLLGVDEAEQVFGTPDPHGLRALLPGPRVLIVKDGEHGVIAFDGEDVVTEPALRVDVVEPVGAGDAFAAGYLAGLLRGYDQKRRLRLGHLCAASTLVVHGDHGALPSTDVLDALLGCRPSQWSATRVSATSLTSPALALAPS